MSPAEIAARLMGAVTCARGAHYADTATFLTELLDDDINDLDVLLVAVNLICRVAEVGDLSDDDLQDLAARLQ